MLKTRIGELENLRKYPSYIISKELERFANPDWYQVCSNNGVFNYASSFWDGYRGKENFVDIFNAFFGVAEKFKEKSIVDIELRSSTLAIFSVEDINLANSLLFRRLKFIVEQISNNNDIELLELFFSFISRSVSKTRNLNILYYFVLHSKNVHHDVGTKTLHYIVDMILKYDNLNWSSIISNIYYSKMYINSDVKLVQKCIDSLERAFLFDGYSTWLMIDGALKEVNISLSNSEIVLVFPRAKDKKFHVLSSDDLTEMSVRDIIFKVSNHFVQYLITNNIAKDIEPDYYANLISTRNTYGYLNREFQFGFQNNNMKQYQCLGSLINFSLDYINVDSINLEKLFTSSFDFISYYSLYLMSKYKIESQYKLLWLNSKCTKKLLKKSKVAYYLTEILKDYYDKLTTRNNEKESNTELNEILKELQENENVNKILVSLDDRINFHYEKHGQEVVVEPVNPVSFGTIKEVSIIDLKTLSSLSSKELIVLLNDIEENKEKYTIEEANFITRNSRGTFEYINENFEDIKDIFSDGLNILRPGIVYYVFDKLMNNYDVGWVINYCSQSFEEYGLERNLLSKVGWYINDEYKNLEDDRSLCNKILHLYKNIMEKSIAFDDLEIDPTKTKYKTISGGLEYVDIDNRFINTIEHNIINPIYLLEFKDLRFTLSLEFVKLLKKEKNQWEYYIWYKYPHIFMRLSEHEKLKLPNAVHHKEISIFGLFSSRALISEYYEAVKEYVAGNPSITLISRNIDAFMEGYSLYAVAGVVNNWGGDLFKKLFKILYNNKKGYHDLSQIMMGLRNTMIDNHFILKGSIDFLLNELLNTNRSEAINNVVLILPMFRSVSKFTKETVVLFDNIASLLDECSSYERLDFVNYVSFGISDKPRTDEEKEIISSMLDKLRVDDFDSYEREQLMELRSILSINQK